MRFFEEQVLATPDSVAVVCQDEELNYGELNERANQLAHHLQKLGVGPEVLVGICLERSLEMVIGILGVLKAGGAYVPLDPSYPQERLSFLLQDTRVPLLITKRGLTEKLPRHDAHTLWLDSDAEVIDRESRENPESALAPENLAYVIYTSGSTGKPKGVMVTHYSLSHYVHSLHTRFGITSDDVYLHTASIAFSSSVRQLMLPLSQGATVVVATSDQIANPLALFDLAKRKGVTVVDFVPSYWRNCIDTLLQLEAEPRAALLQNRLRLILSASEPLSSDIPRDWTNQHPARLINMFGQTETTGIVATYPIPTLANEEIRTVPLGRAIDKAEIRLLDHQMQPVPAGVAGDLYVGGTGLARGYLNRPELTADKFVPDPFGVPGSRLYQTGDMGRYSLEGNFEFLGRLDHQVKVRGYRVELGEIERALFTHPAVRNNVVVMREDSPSDKRLVAYIVPKASASPTVSDLRRHLKEKLPEYMVPAAFVLLDALPLTLTGKVDRRALPAPDRGRRGLEGIFEAPRSRVEQEVARIWCEVLDLEEIGIHDNFLDLGGQSLLATRIISRLQRVLQTELTVRNLFENPTIASLSALIESKDRAEEKSLAPFQRVSREGPLLPSFAQLRLWFLDQLEPNSSVYNIPEAWLLDGPLNISALEQSFNEVVRRHEGLRTTFVTVDGEPVQVISPALTIGLELTDLSSLSESEQAEQTLRLARAEAAQPFDLSAGPLLRGSLLRLNAQKHVLLITTHHIVSDAWSSRIFMNELSRLYDALSAGESSPLPELPVQYADFAQWQRNYLEGEVTERHLAYWKKQLDGTASALNLPLDRPRPAVQTFHGASQPFVLPSGLSESLGELAQRENVTMFMTLLAAFQLLLHHYTGQEDIAVGSPIAGRSRTEVEPLIGFFVNTLVLRTDFSGDPTIRELLGRVREVALGAFDHQDLPFERLVEEMRPDRGTGQTPLFQVMLVLEDNPAKPITLSELTLTPLKHDSETVKFDLILYLTYSESELSGSFAYNTDLFDAETIGRMAGHFQTLLQGIVASPDRHLSSLPLLTAAEEQQLLVAWNDTKVEYPRDKCLHELFEVQADFTPEAIALVFGEEQLSYRELNRRANQVAAYLIEQGVGPEVLVGICMERSVELVVGLLGILKAGGAYVPLDPTYPPERLAFMLSDAEVSVLLTQAGLVERIPNHGAGVICLDSEWERIAQQSGENRVSRVVAENAAYMIYTSGSTGQPKGAINTHGGICNRLLWMQERYQLTEKDRVLQKTPFSFDVSIWEFFWPLLTGATLVVARPGGHQDSDYLIKLIVEQGITTLHFVPSMLRIFLNELRVESCSSLRQVISSGEALPPELQEQFFRRLSGAELHNLYGPTEAAVDVTYWQCERGSDRTVVPIGRPIANTKIYILDRYLKPVPVGIPGELHIGGVGLARGYLKRPGLTAEKFTCNPFSNEVDGRLYKTGDLARYLPDGNIEYLGRLDHQVKIRGFRIELGEIEATIGQHPGIQDAVVVAREDATVGRLLVAYVVPHVKLALPVREQIRLEEAGQLANHSRYELPNGNVVIHLNKNETDFLYEEIFENQAYLRHGITLDDGACVFDVGANIGLFSLFANQLCRNAVIYAFEPIPPVFEILSLNTALYGLNAKLFRCGLSSEAKLETFTYYRNFSIMSGRFANSSEERAVVESFILNRQGAGTDSLLLSNSEDLSEFLTDRMTSENFTCELKTISEVISEHDIDQIDLLKIDVEKSEWDVLAGIRPNDWPKIRQVVVEVHDSDGRLNRIVDLLRTNGFELAVEQDSFLKDTNLYNVYAVRDAKGKQPNRREKSIALESDRPVWSSADGLINNLRQFLNDKLPDYMVPSAFVLLDSIPLTPSGKVDRGALPLPKSQRSGLKTAYVEPQSDLEEIIAVLWRQVLNVKRVGINDNFFDLGGHSLLLMQVHAKLRSVLNREFAFIMMFRYPTVGSLARFLNQESDSQVLQPLKSSREKLIAGKSRREQVFGKRKLVGPFKKS